MSEHFEITRSVKLDLILSFHTGSVCTEEALGCLGEDTPATGVESVPPRLEGVEAGPISPEDVEDATPLPEPEAPVNPSRAPCLVLTCWTQAFFQSVKKTHSLQL